MLTVVCAACGRDRSDARGKADPCPTCGATAHAVSEIARGSALLVATPTAEEAERLGADLRRWAAGSARRLLVIPADRPTLAPAPVVAARPGVHPVDVYGTHV